MSSYNTPVKEHIQSTEPNKPEGEQLFSSLMHTLDHLFSASLCNNRYLVVAFLSATITVRTDKRD
ncbi:hypothetical protein Syun_000352 [Stephania yunnanensis]|uniref:Uncharacterized protein n=1 Tax=Stephania yunnanensis TaxID=152371 RepID=A0AAP0LDI4_9MAGN